MSTLALCLTVLAGSVRVVAPSGAPYTTIQAAVNAAASGDVILVKAGSYPGFTVGNKSLVVVADTGQVVHVHGTSVVQGLGALRTEVLAGLSFEGQYGAAIALQLTNDAGHVRLIDCHVAGLDDQSCLQNLSTYVPVDALRASACADLVVSNSQLFGGGGPTSYINIWSLESGVGALLTASNAGFYGCDLRGGTGLDAYGYCASGANGGDGLNASGSLFFTSGCSLPGGNGAAGNCIAGFGCSEGGNGGDGLEIANSASAYLMGCFASGGFGGWMHGSSGQCCITGVAGLPRRGNAADFHDSSATPRGFAMPACVREGATAQCSLSGVPGDEVGLIVAAEPAFAMPSGFEGVRAVALGPGTVVQRVGTVPASGTLIVQLPVNLLPQGADSDVRHIQPVFVSSTGQRVFGTPRVLVVLDSAF